MASHAATRCDAMNTMRPTRQTWMERAARSLLGLALVSAVAWALTNGADATPDAGMVPVAAHAALPG